MKFDIRNLSRKTANSSFIPEIDGLRFFAIITVVIFHLNTAYSRESGIGLENSIELLGGQNSPAAFGWWLVRLDLGVKVFFAISGFVLALPFLKHYINGGQKVNLKNYFIRRLTRLEPPFIVSLIVFLCVHIFLLNGDALEFLKHFFAGLIYGHVFIYGEPNPINPVTWSLETEAQFYVLVPLLFTAMYLIKNRWAPWIVLIGLMAASAIFKHHYIWSWHVSSSIAAYFMNFGVGILFAGIYLNTNRNFWIIKKSIFDLPGLIAFYGVFAFYKPQHDYLSMLGFNLSILGIFLSAFKGKIFNFFFTRPWVYTIGGMCYTIYLLHYAFFHLWMKLTSGISSGMGYPTDLFLQFLMAIPAVLILSIIYFVLIERPCMDKDWIYKVKLNPFVRKSVPKN